MDAMDATRPGIAWPTGRRSWTAAGEETQEYFTINKDGTVLLRWWHTWNEVQAVPLDLDFVARVLVAWAEGRVGDLPLQALARALREQGRQ